MNDCDWMIILPLLGFRVWSFALSLSFLNPLPNGYMCCFNHLHNFKLLISISGLVKIYIWEIPLWKEKPVSFHSSFCCYLKITFTTLGIFWVLTKWRRCRGMEVQIFPRYERHSFKFDCWWWTTVRYQQGCASFT